MNETKLQELTQLPRFEVGEVLLLNNIPFKVHSIHGQQITLQLCDTETDKWQAFGKAIVSELKTSGLLA